MIDDKDLLQDETWQKMLAAKRPLGLVTGVFDLLHRGHLFFLEKAQEQMHRLLGSLIIGVESDARVRQLKGESRPVQNQELRRLQLEETRYPTVMFVLPENFAEAQVRENFLGKLKPEYLLVSSSTPNLENKRRLIQQFAGELLVVCDHQQGYSTTEMLKLRNGGT